MGFDFTAISNFSLWAYAVVFVAGIVTSIGPCNMAMILLVIAFVGGQKALSRGRSLMLSATFALGLAITLMRWAYWPRSSAELSVAAAAFGIMSYQ